MNPVHAHCVFKSDKARDRAPYMHETAAALMYHMAEWCLLKGYPFVVTETVTTLEEDRTLGRVSNTHRTGRAFDVSLVGWESIMIRKFMEHFDKEWGPMGAISASTGEPTLLVRHDSGHGDHIHVQLSRSCAIDNPLEQDDEDDAVL